MARKDYIMARYEMNWGEGVSDIIGRIQGNTLEMLDYENNTVRIHEECGGRNYYQSRTGMTGAGYVDNLGEWFPVGHYVPIGFWSQQWLYVAQDIQLAVPIIPHHGVSKNHPLVLRTVDEHRGVVFIYCDANNVVNIVRQILERENWVLPWGEAKPLTKHFFIPAEGRKKEYTIKVYDFWGYDTPNPWNFITSAFSDAEVEEPTEELYKLLGVTCSVNQWGETYYRYQKLGGGYYATEYLGDDLSISQLARKQGWETAYGGNVLLKHFPNQVKVVAWCDYLHLILKKSARMRKALPYRGSALEDNSRFWYREETVQKMEFLLNSDQILHRIWSEHIQHVVGRINYLLEDRPARPLRAPRRPRPESDSDAN